MGGGNGGRKVKERRGDESEKVRREKGGSVREGQ